MGIGAPYVARGHRDAIRPLVVLRGDDGLRCARSGARAPLAPASATKGGRHGLAALETTVAERWLVWLGAVALALGLALIAVGWLYRRFVAAV